MEVLFISHKYPPSIGGMQKQSYELIRGYEEHGIAHKITIAPDENKVAFFAKLRRRVNQLLRLHPTIDLIHCNDGVCGFFGQRLLGDLGIPMFVTYHGLDLLWPNSYYQKWLAEGGLKKFAGIICVSDYTADEAIRRGAHPSTVRAVLNGVDEPIWDKTKVRPALIDKISSLRSNKKRLLMSIGRPVKRKGFTWFVKEVLPMLPDDIYYLIVGPRAERSALSKAFRRLAPKSFLKQVDLFLGSNSDQNHLEYMTDEEVGRRFEWLSDLNYHELQYVLSQIDLSIMPNIDVDGDAEGFGLVSLEANMHEKYVIAADIHGVPSAVHDTENGILIESENKNEWREEIMKFLMKSTEEQCEIGKKAKLYVNETFSWERMAAEYHEAFIEMLDYASINRTV